MAVICGGQIIKDSNTTTVHQIFDCMSPANLPDNDVVEGFQGQDQAAAGIYGIYNSTVCLPPLGGWSFFLQQITYLPVRLRSGAVPGPFCGRSGADLGADSGADLGVALGSTCGRFGLIWCPSGADLVSLRQRFLVDLGSSCGRFEPIWCPFGADPGSIWGGSGVSLGSSQGGS